MRISDWSSDVCSSDLSITPAAVCSASAQSTVVSRDCGEIMSDYRYPVSAAVGVCLTAMSSLTAVFAEKKAKFAGFAGIAISWHDFLFDKCEKLTDNPNG